MEGSSLIEAWRRLVGPRGLCAEGTLDGLQKGDRFAIRTAGGMALSGTVEILAPPAEYPGTLAEFAALVEELGDALFWLTLVSVSGGQFATLLLFTYGVQEAHVEAARQQFEDLFTQLFAEA